MAATRVAIDDEVAAQLCMYRVPVRKKKHRFMSGLLNSATYEQNVEVWVLATVQVMRWYASFRNRTRVEDMLYTLRRDKQAQAALEAVVLAVVARDSIFAGHLDLEMANWADKRSCPHYFPAVRRILLDVRRRLVLEGEVRGRKAKSPQPRSKHPSRDCRTVQRPLAPSAPAVRG